MMRQLTYLYLLLLLLSVSGCDTRRHIYQDGWVTIGYTINWDELARASKGGEVAPNGATLAIFPVSGMLEEPIFKQTNYMTGEIALPIGVYNIVVFNETVSGHDYIQFTGTESYDTFQAYWEQSTVTAQYARSSSDQMIIDTEDFLLVERLEGYEVTYDMLESDETPQLYFTPEVVNKLMTVTAHIKGMVNVSAATSSLLYMEGMSLGYMMSSGEPTTDKSTHLTNLEEMSYYDGSESDGTMSASFYTFGDAASETRADDDNVATLSFALRDGTTHPDIAENVSDQLSDSNDLSEINVVVGLNSDITLPDVANTEAGEGMSADVGGWGEEIVIQLDM